MTMGIGVTLPHSGASFPSQPPIATSFLIAQADPLGGDSITILGSFLSQASAVDVDGDPGVITNNTGSLVTFTSPAKLAGNHNVTVTTPGGTTSPLVIEYWAPSTEASCTFCAELPDYVIVGGTQGTWTARVGGNLLATTANGASLIRPPAVAGAPNFTGAPGDSAATSGQLDSASTLLSFMTTSAGSVCVVSNSTNTDTCSTASPSNNPHIVTNNSSGTFGLWAGKVSSVDGWGANFYQGAGVYRFVHFPCTLANINSVVYRWSSTSIELSVAGAAFAAGTAPTGVWASTGGIMRVGANYGNAHVFKGTPRAVALFNVKLSDAVAAKFDKWAKVRHGAA